MSAKYPAKSTIGSISSHQRGDGRLDCLNGDGSAFPLGALYGFSSMPPNITPGACKSPAGRYNVSMPRRFQFSLKEVLIATVFACAGLWWVLLIDRMWSPHW